MARLAHPFSGQHSRALPRPSCKSPRAAGTEGTPVPRDAAETSLFSQGELKPANCDVSWGEVMGGQRERYMK